MRKFAIVSLGISLLLAIALLVSARDESLNEDVSRSLQKPIVAAEKNVYLPLVNFVSPINKDGTELHFTENILSACDKERGGLIDCIVQNRSQIEKMLSDNQTLLDRYQAFLNYTQFSQPLLNEGESTPIPFVDLQRVKLALWAKSILLIKDGKAAEGLDLLHRDTQFWRMLLTQSDNLLTHMVAVTLLRKQYELLSRIVAEFPQMAAAEKNKLLQMIAPLSIQELSFRRALAGELQLVAHALTQLDQTNSCADSSGKDCTNATAAANWSLTNPMWRKTPLYRHNATLNLQAGLLEQWAGFSELPATKIAKQKESFSQSLEKEYKPTTGSGMRVYNYIGKQFVATGFADVSAYFLKAHDLNGLLRLINLQIQITSLGLPDERIGPFLQTSDSEFTNPYTGEAMIWDAKERTLSFPAQGRKDAGEIAVMLGKSVLRAQDKH
ncbi:MAG: hypothetical protein V4568_02720 [Pseudomonadota bacterium]